MEDNRHSGHSVWSRRSRQEGDRDGDRRDRESRDGFPQGGGRRPGGFRDDGYRDGDYQDDGYRDGGRRGDGGRGDSRPGPGERRGARPQSRYARASKSYHERHTPREPFVEKGYVEHKGFSDFQLRLVYSILNDVLQNGRPLDQCYAYWFSKVKIDSLEQGFLTRQINAMLAKLSLYAHVSGLKRPSDSGNHVARIIFSYCAAQNFSLPELSGEEGFDRRGLRARLEEGMQDVLMREGCPHWLEESCAPLLKEAWPAERKALGEPARRFIRTNTLVGTRDELASLLAGEGVVTRSVKDIPTALEVTSNSAIFRTEAFRDGRFEQQDAGSQLIPAFLEVKPGMKVVDACAGAGGKTLQLAADLKGKGTIIALDTEQWKLADLRWRARRARAHNIETRLIDSTKVIKRLHGQADRVLIDAPCSGTGIVRRIPDSKWRDPRNRFRELKDLQQDLLRRYSLMAKPGGLVVYSTCSILPWENGEQVRAFIEAADGEFELLAERQILPSSGLDGFYMARMRRREAPAFDPDGMPPEDISVLPAPSNEELPGQADPGPSPAHPEGQGDGIARAGEDKLPEGQPIH
ncbi:MAG: RsmB/NOP family class I SAM-dependent RNA methyltransferase [Succinivibrionaceae bacterium]|nr:RsmB/NOP family class I SAM-dependent RNA methyltransferase [Succinivibrionaceae bacterium]